MMLDRSVFKNPLQCERNLFGRIESIQRPSASSWVPVLQLLVILPCCHENHLITEREKVMMNKQQVHWGYLAACGENRARVTSCCQVNCKRLGWKHDRNVTTGQFASPEYVPCPLIPFRPLVISNRCPPGFVARFTAPHSVGISTNPTPRSVELTILKANSLCLSQSEFGA